MVDICIGGSQNKNCFKIQLQGNKFIKNLGFLNLPDSFKFTSDEKYFLKEQP